MTIPPVATLAHAGANGAFDRFWEAGPVAAMFTLMSIVMLVATVRANRIQSERLMADRRDAAVIDAADAADLGA